MNQYFQRAVCCFFFLGGLATVAPAWTAARLQDSWAGERVMRKHPKTMIWDDGALTGNPKAIVEVTLITLTVDKESKGYLYVRMLGHKGWVKKDDMVLEKEAIPYYTKLIAQNPNDLFAYNQRAAVWKEKKEYDKALADMNELIRLMPKNAIYHHNRAVIWAAKNEHEKAVGDFDEALRLDTKYMLAHHLRGRSYVALKQYDKAMADLDAAIKLNPKYATLYLDRGNLWETKKDHDKALADYTKGIDMDPADASLHRARGVVQRIKKEYAKALADFNEAIHLNAKYAQAYSDKAWLLATCLEGKLRNGAQAVAAAKHACELTSFKTPAHLSVLAAAYAEAGKFDEAVHWQKAALEFADYAKVSGSRAKGWLKLYEAGKPCREP
jgi:tetratricopeptide (TPR) repeat protein